MFLTQFTELASAIFYLLVFCFLPLVSPCFFLFCTPPATLLSPAFLLFLVAIKHATATRNGQMHSWTAAATAMASTTTKDGRIRQSIAHHSSVQFTSVCLCVCVCVRVSLLLHRACCSRWESVKTCMRNERTVRKCLVGCNWIRANSLMMPRKRWEGKERERKTEERAECD